MFWREIISESIFEISESFKSLHAICESGFSSFTIDGRRGVRGFLEKKFPEIPIQFCQFHQQQIIRRYNSRRPKTDCGRDLNRLSAKITTIRFELEFRIKLEVFKTLHHEFFYVKNVRFHFLHKKIRSSVRSLNQNLPFLFTCRNYPSLKIPNTTNSCDGSFVHFKEKVALHHGLKWHKKVKMIHFFLAQNSDSIS